MYVKLSQFFLFATATLALTVSGPQAQEQSTYDPSPFLSSMISLRAAAVTCEPYVANSPQGRTDNILGFFKTLKQDLPQLVDTETQRSLNKFIASQAAVLCRDKLIAALTVYRAQANIYASSKPDDWPSPPDITNTAWCSTENCLEF